MILSLAMTLCNTVLSPYSTYVDVIDIYKNSLNFIWKECVTGKKTERKAVSGEKLNLENNGAGGRHKRSG